LQLPVQFSNWFTYTSTVKQMPVWYFESAVQVRALRICTPVLCARIIGVDGRVLPPSTSL
jgi:hypothetical protein